VILSGKMTISDGGWGQVSCFWSAKQHLAEQHLKLF
jgi:hypothetical protein